MRRHKKAISIFLSVFLFFNLVVLETGINQYETKAETVTTDVQSINILEIQPGKGFELNPDALKTAFNGKVVELTQMTMPQFIANNDYINGKYDMVYIGDNVVNNVNYTVEGEKITGFDFKTNLSEYNYSTEQYASENDITYKRAGNPLLPEQQNYSVGAGLQAFIKSGQPVIFSDKIFTNTGLRQTKLYKNFIGFRNNSNYPNFKLTNITSTDTITAAKVFSIFSESNSKKRPVIRLKNIPKPYTGANTSYTTDRVLTYVFDATNLNSSSSSMTAKLYLDIDGDSLYNEEECVKQKVLTGSGMDFTLDYRLNENFYGVMPWKLEVTDNSTNAKSYRMGSFAFMGKPLEIRLLQLVPNNNTLNIESMTVPLYETGKYIINVTRMTVDNFKNNYPNNATALSVATFDSNYTRTVSTNVTVPTVLNGNYDMILTGFSDTYNSQSIADTDTVANAIKDFIKTGQSVMFTHDTIAAFRNWGFKNAKYFKDIAGQSRFYDKFNPSQQNPDGTLIPHENVITAGNVGFTKAILLTGKYTYTNTVKFNDGVITNYPYVLGNITVAPTHRQWQQLNLEDENVVPWYTLNADSYATTHEAYFDKLDARNTYYTYSKGNITFSGTGHSAPKNTEEQKLFVNTILKASRSANHAPTVAIYNLATDQIVTKAQDSLNFSYEVNDIDLNDLITAQVYINNQAVGTPTTGIKSGQTIAVEIPQSTLSGIVGNNSSFTVKVVAKDKKNAEGFATVGLQYSYKIPTADISSDKPSYGALIGDSIDVNLAVTAYKGDNLDTTLSITQQPSTTINSTGINMVSGSSWALSTITFKGTAEPNPKTQTNTLKFTAAKVGNYNVSTSFKYKFSNLLSGQVQTKSITYPINVKSGTIDVKVIGTTKSVEVKVLRNGSEFKKGSTTNGTISFYDLPSGSYVVTMAAPTAYTLLNDNQNVTLSFNNNIGLVEFDLNAEKPAKPILTPSTTAPTNKPVTVTATFHGEPVQEISTDNGITWVPYTTALTIEENGITILARAKNEAELYSDIAQLTINNIDKTPPSADLSYKTIDGVSYDPVNWTNKDVVAMLTNFDSNDVTVTLSGAGTAVPVTTTGTSGMIVSHTFVVPEGTEATPSMSFILRDAAGNETVIPANAKIDKKGPTATLTLRTIEPSGLVGAVYDPANWTNKNVVFELSSFDSQDVKVSASTIDPSKLITDDVTNPGNKTVSYTTEVAIGDPDQLIRHEFVLTDRAGNTSTIVGTAKIDMLAPTATIQVVISDNKQSATSTATPSEPVTYTQPGNSNTHVSTKSELVTFEFYDKAGNTGTKSEQVNLGTAIGGDKVFRER